MSLKKLLVVSGIEWVVALAALSLTGAQVFSPWPVLALGGVVAIFNVYIAGQG